ncbi:unnamed protein product [Echinostoma caproni]|uniref:RT_RNaseH domain-containing protein n=1 Tax=Echinostoma caproni TaxID=27848 RepID=A0A183AWU3_9TREM|nr:unnamed protein product [Echinostoma caproni]
MCSKDAYSLLKNLAFSDCPISLSFESLKKLLLKHLQPANFEDAERAKFHSLTCGGSQPVRDFILQLQTQASRCNFQDQLQTQLRGRLTAGINYPELQQKLLLMHDCTFQLATAVCKQYQDVRAIIYDESSLSFNVSDSKQPPSRQKRTVSRPFSPQLHSTVITDALPVGIGAVLEQNGHPVLCISRRLTAAKRGHSQTQGEALTVYWVVTRMHKYLYGTPFTIVSDHEALQFIYNPQRSLAKSSAAMVQRWSMRLSPILTTSIIAVRSPFHMQTIYHALPLQRRLLRVMVY